MEGSYVSPFLGKLTLRFWANAPASVSLYIGKSVMLYLDNYVMKEELKRRRYQAGRWEVKNRDSNPAFGSIYLMLNSYTSLKYTTSYTSLTGSWSKCQWRRSQGMPLVKVFHWIIKGLGSRTLHSILVSWYRSHHLRISKYWDDS